MKATLRNLLTGQEVSVHSTTDSPDSSYGLKCWVDAEGQSYGQIQFGAPLGFELIMPQYYMHARTGSVDTREGWIAAYPAEELEQRGLTAEAAFEADEGITLIEVEADEAPDADDVGSE